MQIAFILIRAHSMCWDVVNFIWYFFANTVSPKGRGIEEVSMRCPLSSMPLSIQLSYFLHYGKFCNVGSLFWVSAFSPVPSFLLQGL